jgi:hypothetical protein
MIRPMTFMSPAVDRTDLPPRRFPGRDDVDPSRLTKILTVVRQHGARASRLFRYYSMSRGDLPARTKGGDVAR